MNHQTTGHELQAVIAELKAKLTESITFLHECAQDYAAKTSTNDWLNGFHEGRKTAFTQAAYWQQEILDNLEQALPHEPTTAQSH